MSTLSQKILFDCNVAGNVSSFRKHVYRYYDQHGRSHLPWRTDFNPYHIFISEVMLQQTQVDRVISKFIEFTTVFENFKSLADSRLEHVLSHWKGLGYNRRAVSLRNAARIIVDTHNGVLPDTAEQLVQLPGIGPATASSICAFAFNKPMVFLETNIRTVLIYHFFNVPGVVDDTELFPIARKILDTKKPRQWYSALMDYGTMLKKTVGNETQKSKGYKKQSPFKGSRRQLRGNILKQLLEHRSMSAKKLAENCTYDYSQVVSVLDQLTQENMVRCEKNRYSIGV